MDSRTNTESYLIELSIRAVARIANGSVKGSARHHFATDAFESLLDLIDALADEAGLMPRTSDAAD